MSETVTAANGVQLPLDSLAATLTWSGNFINTIIVIYNTITYTQTFTNNGTEITSISQWVPS